MSEVLLTYRHVCCSIFYRNLPPHNLGSSRKDPRSDSALRPEAAAYRGRDRGKSRSPDTVLYSRVYSKVQEQEPPFIDEL
jgi:hypothetical protein